VKDEEEDSTSVDFENKLQVLMISSPNRHDLVFPKGGWEDDETVLEAASREAMEEAGVKGILRVSFFIKAVILYRKFLYRFKIGVLCRKIH
jgi:8-oxo-dGTP pyrophosphatase MutT (NUDIX family)